MPHLLLIDGYSFVFRAYHSLPPLTRPDGTPVGAVYGFTNMLMKLLSEHTADHIAVIFDAGSKTFRNELYPAYKANRPPAPEDLIPQFPLVREAAEALNLPIIEKPGYEADDIIATYVREAKARGNKVTIVSSDKDLMQLIDANVTMYDGMKSRTIAEKEVEEKFGVGPEKVLDVLSLIGDSSDNVPGVPGIGPKTAAELITTYGSLDELLARANEITQNKRRENLIAFKAQAELSRDLIRLEENVPDLPAYDDLVVRNEDSPRLLAFLEQQNFKALIARVAKLHEGVTPTQTTAPAPNKERPFTLIETESVLNTATRALWLTGSVALWPVHHNNAVIGLAVSNAEQDFYIPLHTNTATQTSLFDEPAQNTGLALSALKPLLEDPTILKISYDIKPLITAAKRENITLSPYDDIQVMAYVLRAGLDNQELPTLCEQYLGEPVKPLTDLLGSGKTAEPIETLPAQKTGSFFTHYSQALYQLNTALRKQLLSDRLLTVYETIERPLISVLADMERIGIKVNPAILHQLSEDFGTRMAALETSIYALAGHPFNLGSPKQLGEVLFDEMGIKPGGKAPKRSAKSGAYSTSADILEELASEGHTIAEQLIEWRQLSKLKSTYTDALTKQIAPEDGRLHTHFMMAVTSTGRLSSTDPNLQNIPVRTEEGYKIREAFVPEKGYSLLSADYSQIELRLLANIANIETLQEAFRNGDDIHALTASQIFGVPLENMDPATRRKAKAINFGIIYGISGFGLARQLGIPRQEAADYIEKYFARYPGIRRFMETTKEHAREQGYVSTLFGRKCFIKGMNDKRMQSFAERAAINAPLQGTAADLIKRAMIALPSALQAEGIHARMILQVHDELLFEVKHEEEDRACPIIKRTMENVANFAVPLVVEVGCGANWREIH